jgi:hypothetical protein
LQGFADAKSRRGSGESRPFTGAARVRKAAAV